MPPRPRADRRIARWIARWGAMLLIAAAINVLVAWTCVLWMHRRNTQASITAELDPTPPSRTRRLCRLQWVDDESIWREDRDWRRLVSLESHRGFGVEISQLYLHATRYMRAGGGEATIGRVTVVECGWPFLSLECAHSFFNADVQEPRVPAFDEGWPPADLVDSAARWQSAWHAPYVLGSNPVLSGLRTHWRPLPYAIRPFPFTLNTFFWLAVIAIPGPILRAARRRLRTRRGRCPTCAYDLQTLTTCPECGTPRPPRPARPATTSPRPE
ncbi:MAG: hypothetical protein R3B68_05475 [Phycisphaerales bacterium]